MNARRTRRGPIAAVAASVGALAVTGVLVWTLLPGLTGDGDPAVTEDTLPKVSAEPFANEPAEETEAPEPEPENLLTAAGIRDAIRTLKPVIGGTKVVRMVVYPTYAAIDAPVKGDASVYDTFSYRDGAATRVSKGGTVRTRPVDLEKYNWDALPALLRKAETSLRVPKPTTRYLIIDTDSMFTASRQALLVYVGDDYRRTGYLVADLQGKVVKMYPSS